MAKLYERASEFILANTSFHESPIMGKGYFEFKKVKLRHEYKMPNFTRICRTKWLRGKLKNLKQLLRGLWCF